MREARGEAGAMRSFEVRTTATLVVEANARSAAVLGAFDRYASADWKRGTVALR